MNNDPPHTELRILFHVVTSAAIAELEVIFHNGKTTISLRTTLKELEHQETNTLIETDNPTELGILNPTYKQKKNKAMDMIFYWVEDRKRQVHLFIYWVPGKANKADCFTNII